STASRRSEPAHAPHRRQNNERSQVRRAASHRFCTDSSRNEAVSMDKPGSSGRWFQLTLGVIVMMTISSPQYVWTLFVKSFQTTTGATLPAVQITFSLLIVLQTWLSPAQGFLVERYSPKALIALGAAMSGLGWIASAQATSLTG